MITHGLIFSLFIIFSGAAIVATFALFTRQSTLVAYILLGILLGPWSFKLIRDVSVVQKIGEVGIIFLLFLLGLELPPQKLINLLKKTTWVAIMSSLLFLLLGYMVGWIFNYTESECWIIGAVMMFSSTIIGIKLLPTNVLHHLHTGELMVSILLFQDLIAILVLVMIHAVSMGESLKPSILLMAWGFPFIIAFAFLFERLVLIKLVTRFNRVKEYVFLLAIGWCLSLSELAAFMGLSHEIGAFIAGVTLAASPISIYISESLKPIRDFFLVLFFFSVGASFNLTFLHQVLLPSLVLVAMAVLIKPLVYYFLMRQVHERKDIAWELGIRLGQISEFSLIIAYMALHNALIGFAASYLIQAATIIAFIISSYWVVWKYPTPMAVNDRLRRD